MNKSKVVTLPLGSYDDLQDMNKKDLGELWHNAALVKIAASDMLASIVEPGKTKTKQGLMRKEQIINAEQYNKQLARLKELVANAKFIATE